MASRPAHQRNKKIDTTRVREANTRTTEEKEQSQSTRRENGDLVQPPSTLDERSLRKFSFAM